MKNKIFEILQRVGRSFMLPIAILPVAGLLLGVGQSLTNETMLKAYGLMKIMGPHTLIYQVLRLCGDCGQVIFDNLPLIFAIGVSIGMARAQKEVAALSGAIAFFVMHKSISTMIAMNGIHLSSSNGALTTVLGMRSLQMGMFGGLIVGLGVAALHNRFYRIRLPDFLSFYGGTRFVPIISAIVYVFVGILMYVVWQPIQSGMYNIGQVVRESGYFGTFVYGVTERALIPFGLHHVFYLPFWQTSVGGVMEVGGRVVEGAQNIFFAQLADPATKHFSVEATRFMAGKYPFMIFGLPGATLAMYKCAKPGRKKVVSGLLLSAALTSLLTGITEPIEFAFLFVAPGLYALHCGFAGLSYMLMHIFKVCVGMTFSGGLIDLFLFGTLQGEKKTNWLMVIPVGIIYFVGYYYVFSFCIKRFDLLTPGRDELKQSNQEIGNHFSTNINPKKKLNGLQMSALIVKGLGGKSNIIDIDCCVTRLRCCVRHSTKINENILGLVGSRGVMRRGKGIQIIFGPEVTEIKSDVEAFMKSDYSEDEFELPENVEKEAAITSVEKVLLPIRGKIMELYDVGDEIFSEGMLGEGFGIEPLNGKIVSPVNGRVTSVFYTKHALAITSEEGAEILIHIGLNTVKLDGKYFQINVEAGQQVKMGEDIGQFDLKGIIEEGYSPVTPVVISNSADYSSITLEKVGVRRIKTHVLTLKKR